MGKEVTVVKWEKEENVPLGFGNGRTWMISRERFQCVG